MYTEKMSDINNQNISVDIIVLNWNGWRDTIECVKSLCKSNHKKKNIIIVDNNSTDESYLKIKSWIFAAQKKLNLTKKELVLIKSDSNNGYASGNNIGIRYSLRENNPNYIWILNNDTLVEQDTLSNLIKKGEDSSPNTGIIGSLLVYEQDRNTIQAVGGKYSPTTGRSKHICGGLSIKKFSSRSFSLSSIDYIVGASMFVRSKFIKDVGLMTEDYFLYCEELDWIARGRNHGFIIDVCPEAVVYHKEGASTGAGRGDIIKQARVDFYSTRSHLIYTYRFNKNNVITVKLVLLLVAIKRALFGSLKSSKIIFSLIKLPYTKLEKINYSHIDKL